MDLSWNKYEGKSEWRKNDIHVFSRNGKSGTENKYDIPPLQIRFIFGNFALVKWDRDEEDYVDFSLMIGKSIQWLF